MQPDADVGPTRNTRPPPNVCPDCDGTGWREVPSGGVVRCHCKKQKQVGESGDDGVQIPDHSGPLSEQSGFSFASGCGEQRPALGGQKTWADYKKLALDCCGTAHSSAKLLEAITEDFWEFRCLNPHIEPRLVERSRELKVQGHKRYGMSTLLGQIRYEEDDKRPGAGDSYKLNDHVSADYSRWLMYKYQDIEGFFIIRARRRKRLG